MPFYKSFYIQDFRNTLKYIFFQAYISTILKLLINMRFLLDEEKCLVYILFPAINKLYLDTTIRL